MRGLLHPLHRVGLGLALASAACNAELCDTLYERNKECAPEDRRDKMGDKGKFGDKCRADRDQAKADGTWDPEGERAIAACLQEADCGQLQRCMTAESERRYTQRQLDVIATAKASEDIEQMKAACQYVSEENAALVDACRDVVAKLYTHTLARVTTLRDEGDHDFALCGELEQFAHAVGGDAVPTAKAACGQAQAAETVAKAVREAESNAKARQADMPYACGAALDELAKVDSAWARGKKAEVVHACFQTLGLVIMEVKVPQMNFVCDFRVKEIYKAVTEYGVDDEAMRGWMAKAKPLCEDDETADEQTEAK